MLRKIMSIHKIDDAGFPRVRAKNTKNWIRFKSLDIPRGQDN